MNRRQTQIIAMMSSGMLLKQAAYELGIAYQSGYTSLHKAKIALGAESIPHVALIAQAKGYISSITLGDDGKMFSIPLKWRE